MWQKPVKNSQRRGPDLNLPSGFRISSSLLHLYSVGTIRREGVKCQNNGTAVVKFDLGQAEEYRGHCVLR